MFFQSITILVIHSGVIDPLASFRTPPPLPSPVNCHWSSNCQRYNRKKRLFQWSNHTAISVQTDQSFDNLNGPIMWQHKLKWTNHVMASIQTNQSHREFSTYELRWVYGVNRTWSGCFWTQDYRRTPRDCECWSDDPYLRDLSQLSRQSPAPLRICSSGKWSGPGQAAWGQKEEDRCYLDETPSIERTSCS